MSTLTLSKWGNCLAIRVPKSVLEQNNWQAGDQLDYEFNLGKLTLQKVRKVKKYDLAELLEGMESMPKEDIVDWGAPQGREVW
jgi:antitoxin MazE